MALMAIAQHHGRPGTPTDQAHVESVLQPSEGRLAAPDRHHRSGRARHRARPDPHRVQHGSPPRLDRVRHPRRRASRPRAAASAAPAPPGMQARPRRADQAESSQQEMTAAHRHRAAPALPLGKRGAFEGVARRHGRRRNSARTTPRSSAPNTQPSRLRHTTLSVGVEKSAALTRTQKHRNHDQELPGQPLRSEPSRSRGRPRLADAGLQSSVSRSACGRPTGDSSAGHPLAGSEVGPGGPTTGKAVASSNALHAGDRPARSRRSPTPNLTQLR